MTMPHLKIIALSPFSIRNFIPLHSPFFRKSKEGENSGDISNADC
jgi:hypothetical protein